MSNVFKAIVLFIGVSVLVPVSHGAPGSASKPAAKSQPSGPAASSASAARPVSKSLDQVMVKKYYSEGDFDPAITILEEFQKTHSQYTREESLMVYKYLGVMYCADQGTREKGKTYFYKLLKIEPEAKILDMYVSIVVQDIFKSTLDELMGQDGFPAAKREDRLSAPEPKPRQETFPSRKEPAKEPEEKKISGKKNNAIYWWIGGLAVAGAAAGGYYLFASSDLERTETETHITP